MWTAGVREIRLEVRHAEDKQWKGLMAAQSLGKTARHDEDKEGRWCVPGVALSVAAGGWPLGETSRCVRCASARELHAKSIPGWSWVCEKVRRQW